MADKRAPEEVLYAFSQWLQQWADYALSQAQGFSTSAAPNEAQTTSGSPPASSQPPAHWLEQIPHGPPAHWLALFEEYGLKPPEADTPPGDLQIGSETLEATPRPLQDWLADFQRGLEQFTQPPAPLSSKPGEPDLGTSALSMSVPGKDPVPESLLPTPAKDEPVTERQATGEEDQPAAPTESSFPSLPPTRISLEPGIAERSALSTPPQETARPEHRADFESSQPERDQVEPTPPTSSPAQHVIPNSQTPRQAAISLASDPTRLDEVDESPLAPESSLTLPITSSSNSKGSFEKDGRLSHPAAEERVDPAPLFTRTAQLEREEARATPVRLRLNSPPPVPAPAPQRKAEERIAHAKVQPSQAVAGLVPRLAVGVQASANPLPSTPSAVPVAPVEKSSRGKTNLPSRTFAAAENTTPRPEPDKEGLPPDMDLEGILAAIRRREESPPSSLPLQSRTEQPHPTWAPPAPVQWPRLPERLPTIHPPSNVLADPAHRMRINREQRGRSWNT